MAALNGKKPLRACGHAWHLPVAVRGEVQFVRQPDPHDPSKLISVPVDLTPLISAGVLKKQGGM